METTRRKSGTLVEIYGKGYLKFNNGKVRGYISPALAPIPGEQLLNPDSLLVDSDNLKPGSRSVFCSKIDLSGRSYFLKRYNYRNFFHALKYSMRRSRPERNMITVAKLQTLGIRVPEVHAALTVKHYLPYHHSFLLTEYLGTGITADKFIDRIYEGVGLEHFIRLACYTLKTIHDAGVAHGDLKLSNIFLNNVDTDEMSIGLLDFDGATIRPCPRSKQRRTHEIARLISSWLKLCQRAGFDVGQSPVCQAFISQYRELTGINIKTNSLNRHIRHFLRH